MTGTVMVTVMVMVTLSDRPDAHGDAAASKAAINLTCCGKRFAKAANYAKLVTVKDRLGVPHQRGVLGKFMCPDCGTSCKEERGLRLHTSYVHSGERPGYRCSWPLLLMRLPYLLPFEWLWMQETPLRARSSPSFASRSSNAGTHVVAT